MADLKGESEILRSANGAFQPQPRATPWENPVQVCPSPERAAYTVQVNHSNLLSALVALA
jgi:hypothetical protein